MIKCKGCGADIPFVPETQNYVCEYCGTVMTHEELTAAQQEGDIKAEEQKVWEEKKTDKADTQKTEGTAGEDSDYIEVIKFTCPQCGGELFTTEDTAATFCSYCGASVLLERRVSKEMKPDYIIPFKVTKEQAADIFQKKMSKAIFAPSYIRHMDIEKIRGIYMPYWTYSLKGSCGVNAKKTENRPVPGGTECCIYNVTADLKMQGDGIEYDAASSFPDDLSQGIAPYDFKEARQFSASFMSGFYADAGDVDQEQYYRQAMDVMKDLGAEKAAAAMRVMRHEVRKSIPDIAVEGSRAMYPVWFVSARNKVNKKISYAVINGQSGKISADIPIDNKKLILGMLCIAIPLFALLYFLISPTPQATTWVVMLLSLIGGAFGVLKLIRLRKKTQGKVGSLLSLILFAAAVLVCLFILLINPVKDIIFYVGVIIAGICSGLSYWTLFSQHNKASLRKLPQLGKRGGDE